MADRLSPLAWLKKRPLQSWLVRHQETPTVAWSPQLAVEAYVNSWSLNTRDMRRVWLLKPNGWRKLSWIDNHDN